MKRFNFKDFRGKVIRVDYFDTTRIAFLKHEDVYLVVTESFDSKGVKGRTIVDYCTTYIDAYYHYKALLNEQLRICLFF